MFGSSNPFGQSSSSFGSPSVFGSSTPFGSQTGSSIFGGTAAGSSSTTNNPFAPKPFGGTTPFGAQTGSSIFGGTSTGMFGAAQSSSPFSASTAFGASSSSPFGSSMPAFGASSSPAFGASSSPAFGASSSAFGASSAFGQKPAFGGFGSTAQTSPFGSTPQQSQPAFGSSLFGSSTPFGQSSPSPFGAASTPAFGAASTPAFGATSSPAFGSTSTPAFGATSQPAFGVASAPAFGSTSTPAFGSTGTAFGASTTPVFGSSSTPAFGATSTSVFGSSSPSMFGASSSPAFGASSQPAFGASSAAFGASSAPAFGGSSSPSFSFGSAPAFGQSASTFGSSPFGATSSPFGAQSSPFGAQATTPTFGSSGQSAFGAQRGGSRVVPYTATTETDVGAGAQAGKLESISAMPTYKDKSHEELRWEDYQLGDKGGPAAPGQSPSGIGFGVSAAQSNPFATSSPFGQSSAGAFSTPASSNPFAPKTSTFLSSSTPSFSSPFATSSSPNPFQSTVGTTSPFGQSSSPSLFGTASTSVFGSTPSLFSSSMPQGGLSFANTQASPFQSTTPAFGQTGSAFGSTFGQSTTPSFTPGLFNTPSTGFGGSLFSSTPSLNTSTSLFGQTTPSQSSPFQLSQPSQPPASGFGGFGQTQMAGSSGFPGASSMFGQSNFGQLAATQGSAAVQPMPVTNPFGTLPAMPQVSIGRSGTTPSVQYGISSLPVVDKPAPLRISSLLTTRHLSQRRFRLPSQKYHPKNDGQKVPFFSDEEDTPSNPKADALFIPRENPRALFIRPVDQWPQKAKKVSPMKDASTPVNENGTVLKFNNASVNGTVDGQRDAEDGMRKEQADHVRPNQKSNGIHEDHSTERQEPYVTLNGHRAGEAAIVYEHGADIEAMMPKLRRSDYYTEPKIQELAAKERAEPGFCRHVKDFVVGRHGYGSIKFFGETDVRRLDLESIVQFNNKEVIVYVDDSKKPPVGQGLNKPAEVTLLNIKCFDKKTKQQYTEGPKVEKYREMLIKRTEEQGAEFVLYDPVKGEWKFRVKHFSKYVLDDETQEEEEEKEETCGERKEEEGKEESCGKRRKS